MKKKQLKKTSLSLFGKWVDRYSKYFQPLKKNFLKADLKMLFRTYVAIMFFLTVIAFIGSLLFFIPIFVIFKPSLLITIVGLIFLPLGIAGLTFAGFYLYPRIRIVRRKNNIETNLPFAITQMSAIAGSGVPPYSMFKIISGSKEYGEISRETGKIARNIDFFGMDQITAMKDVYEKTPSREFKEVLQGISTITQSGGDLKAYLAQRAEKSLFDYRLNREKYVETLSVYADIYTALLIAAPLLMISILAILNLIGGQLFGFQIQDLIIYSVFILIPVFNVVFLTFIHITQPNL